MAGKGLTCAVMEKNFFQTLFQKKKKKKVGEIQTNNHHAKFEVGLTHQVAGAYLA